MMVEYPELSDFKTDPLSQFNLWYEDRQNKLIKDPNTVCLSTVSSEGQPSSRIVLLKEAGTNGFIFYTNYESRKGKELTNNPNAALLFYWPELSRQIRVEGIVEKVSPEISDEYFHSRPEASKISAWASAQSSPIHNRAELETKAAEIENRFQESLIPRPPHWGGFRLVPNYYEFWMAHPYRLHHRAYYRLISQGNWEKGLLAP